MGAHTTKPRSRKRVHHLRLIMCSLKTLLVVVVLVAAASAQNSLREAENNRCIQLLKPAFQGRLDTVVTGCVRKTRNIQVDDSLKKELVARCIALGLGLTDKKGNINKPYVKSLIESSTTLTDAAKNRLQAGVDNCNNFRSCLAKECRVV